MKETVIALVAVLLLSSINHCASRATKGFTVVPGNVESLADILHPQTEITDKYIKFPKDIFYSLYLRVSLGEVEPDSTIVVTLGLDKESANDPNFAAMVYIANREFADYYGFMLEGKNMYNRFPPCRPMGSQVDDQLVSEDSDVPRVYRMSIEVSGQFGWCETGHENGYINPAKFSDKVDLSGPLDLSLRAAVDDQHLSINFLSVQIF